MTQDRSDDTLDRSDTAHRPWRLRSNAGGGFKITGSQVIEARPEGADLLISVDGGTPGVRLFRDEAARGWVLADLSDKELGRVSSLTGGAIAEDPPSVLLSDGRFFRVVSTSGGYAMLGWEGPGPYLEFVFERSEWLVRETAAGLGMERLDRLILLAAATILADEPPAA